MIRQERVAPGQLNASPASVKATTTLHSVKHENFHSDDGSIISFSDRVDRNLRALAFEHVFGNLALVQIFLYADMASVAVSDAETIMSEYLRGANKIPSKSHALTVSKSLTWRYRKSPAL